MDITEILVFVFNRTVVAAAYVVIGWYIIDALLPEVVPGDPFWAQARVILMTILGMWVQIAMFVRPINPPPELRLEELGWEFHQ